MLFRHMFAFLQNTNFQIIILEACFVLYWNNDAIPLDETELFIKSKMDAKCWILPAFREIQICVREILTSWKFITKEL
jgi:hypothetical protein